VYKRVQGNGDKEKMECLSARNIFLMGKKREEAWRGRTDGVFLIFIFIFLRRKGWSAGEGNRLEIHGVLEKEEPMGALIFYMIYSN
jgi:hypothetical protein